MDEELQSSEREGNEERTMDAIDDVTERILLLNCSRRFLFL